MKKQSPGFHSAALLLAIVILLSAAGCGYREVPLEPTVPEESLSPSPTPSPTPRPTPTPEPTPEPTLDLSGPIVPKRDAPAEDSYFADAAFLGNSLMDGFSSYSGITSGAFYAAASLTVLGVDSYISSMPADAYKKVYILLGINEIGFEPDYFKELYSAVLDKVAARQPHAIIYIMGLSPVTQRKSDADPTFSMDKIRAYNAKLFELAGERGFYYTDLCEALADSDGYLPEDISTDGIHLTTDGYPIWLTYLREHYI